MGVARGDAKKSNDAERPSRYGVFNPNLQNFQGCWEIYPVPSEIVNRTQPGNLRDSTLACAKARSPTPLSAAPFSKYMDFAVQPPKVSTLRKEFRFRTLRII